MRDSLSRTRRVPASELTRPGLRTAVTVATLQLLASLLLSPAGCSPRPSAPALEESPYYDNKQEGFRFEAPDSWKMTARGEYPGGRTETERLLVEYRRLKGDSPAALLVTMVDLPESDDLVAHFRNNRTVSQWKLKPVEPLLLGGRKAERFVFQGTQGKFETVQEVVVVRRGSRVYFFTGIYRAGDNKAREQIRGAVGSVAW
jgi:hypothetical protein